MKKTCLNVLIIALFSVNQFAFASTLMEKRQQKAQENMEQRYKAREAIKEAEEAREGFPEASHPHEKIDPQTRKNLFEEMENEGNPRNPRQDQQSREE